MAQMFPRHRLVRQENLDPDPINENFQEVVSTIEGNLGEQNWASDAVSNSAAQTNIAGEIHSTSVEVPRKFEKASGEVRNKYISLEAYDGDKNVFVVPTNRAWTTVIEFTPTFKGGTIWIMASWQQDYFSGELRDQNFPGVQYCLSVGGTRIAESTIGSLDRANDRRGEAHAVWKSDFVTDAILPITSGEHTVSLQARMVPTRDYTDYDSDKEAYVVGNRELIVLEMT